MILAVSLILIAGVLLFVLFVRKNDIPEAVAVSPVAHLEERKATLYDNLRDLNFEYRLGKLSEPDYLKTKNTLQQELAKLMAEMERILSRTPAAAAPTFAPKAAQKPALSCTACGAKFDKPMKFCGECGAAIQEVRS
jgi:hypothetical protein